MTQVEKMAAFLEYAGPRLAYIFEDDRLEKSAGPWKTVTEGLTRLFRGGQAAAEGAGKAIGEGAAAAAEGAGKVVGEGAGQVAKELASGTEGAGKAVAEDVGKAVSDAGVTAGSTAENAAKEVGEAATKEPGNAWVLAAKELGLGTLSHLNDWTTGLPGDLLQRIGRWTGALGERVQLADGTRKFIPTKGAKGISDRIYQAGEWLHNHTTGALREAREANLKELERAGVDPKNVKWIRRAGTTAGLAATMGPVMVAPLALGSDHPISRVGDAIGAPFTYLHPMGWAFTGLEKGTHFIKQKAFDAAADAAYQTQEGIMKGLGDAGRMAYLGGALSPEKFTQAARQRALDQMKERFAAQAQQMGLKNSFEDMVNKYQMKQQA